MMFDTVSYLLGISAGKGNVVIRGGSSYDFADPEADGNIVVVEEDSNG